MFFRLFVSLFFYFCCSVALLPSGGQRSGTVPEQQQQAGQKSVMLLKYFCLRLADFLATKLAAAAQESWEEEFFCFVFLCRETFFL